MARRRSSARWSCRCPPRSSTRCGGAGPPPCAPRGRRGPPKDRAPLGAARAAALPPPPAGYAPPPAGLPRPAGGRALARAADVAARTVGTRVGAAVRRAVVAWARGPVARGVGGAGECAPAAAARDGDRLEFPRAGRGAPGRVLVRADSVRVVSVGAPLEPDRAGETVRGARQFPRRAHRSAPVDLAAQPRAVRAVRAGHTVPGTRGGLRTEPLAAPAAAAA